MIKYQYIRIILSSYSDHKSSDKDYLTYLYQDQFKGHLTDPNVR